MSADVVCFQCRRNGWCKTHGIADEARFDAWCEGTTFEQQMAMLEVMQKRAEFKNFNIQEEAEKFLGFVGLYRRVE